MDTSVISTFYNTEDLEDLLITHILNYRASRGGIHVSNKGGWHSNYEIFTDKSIVARKLFTFIEECSKSIGIDRVTRIISWANVNQYGSYNVKHSHIVPSKQEGEIPSMSGIYYVYPGNHDARTVFYTDLDITYISPEPNKCLLFPSELEHRVETYLGNEFRISVAFNIFE